MFKKPIIKILTFIFTIFWTFPVFSELFENKISRKRCKYSLIHPHSSLFKGNAEKDTGFQLDRSNFKKLILQKKLWNQYTFDGVIPETSIYLKSNCISNGSIRNNTAVYLIERFSGKTIHLKEVYLPSRKLIQIIPSKKLRPGSAYIYVLKSKTSKIKIKKNHHPITSEKNSDYYNRLYRIVQETTGIQKDEIIDLSEIHIRSNGSILGPFIRFQNLAIAKYGEKKVVIASIKLNNGIHHIKGYFYSPDLCYNKKCSIKQNGNHLTRVYGKKRNEFEMLIPAHADSLKIIQFTVEPFQYKEIITKTNFFQSLLKEGSLSAVRFIHYSSPSDRPDMNNAGFWIQSIIDSTLLSHQFKNHISEALKERGIHLNGFVSIAGFGPKHPLSSEMHFNPYIQNCISLESSRNSTAPAEYFLRPHDEIKKLNYEGLLPETLEEIPEMRIKNVPIKSLIKTSDRNQIYRLFRSHFN